MTNLPWHSLIAHTPVVILVVDRDHRIQYLNHTETGMPPEPLIGKSLSDFVAPETRESIRQRLDHVFATGKSEFYEAPALREDGQEHWYQGYYGPVLEGDQVIAVSLVVVNVSALKATEHERDQAKTVLQATVESLEAKVQARTSELQAANEALRQSYDEYVAQARLARSASERQQRALEHMLQASDHERQLIAYDIHDGLAQHLAGAIMQFEVYGYRKESNPKDAADAYQAGLTMLRQSHAETRRLISGVRPPILDESGVLAAISYLANERRPGKHPQIEIRSKVTFNRMPAILENAIYRIVQEAITNACKHSQSSAVRVSLVQKHDRLLIEVRDWGVGFDPVAAGENRFGLAGIRERARLLGGNCRIKSKLGKGSVIIVELPVVEREEE